MHRYNIPAAHVTLQFLPDRDQTHLLQELFKLSYGAACLEKPWAATSMPQPQRGLLCLHSPLLFSPSGSTSWLEPAQSQRNPKEQRTDTHLLLMEPRLPRDTPAQQPPCPSLAAWGPVALFLPRLLSCCRGGEVGHKSGVGTPSPQRGLCTLLLAWSPLP